MTPVVAGPSGGPLRVDGDAVLGSLLRTLRLTADLTLERAAARAELPVATVAAAEDGSGLLPYADVRRLVAAYGLPFVSFTARFERALARTERRARQAARGRDRVMPAAGGADGLARRPCRRRCAEAIGHGA